MFREKVEQLYQELLKNPEVEIHNFVIFPGLVEKVIQNIEKDIFLPQVVKFFFSEMNGFQLSYTFKSNQEFDKEQFGYYEDEFPKMWPNHDNWPLDGCINFLPLDFSINNDWKDYIWYNMDVDQEIEFKGKKYSERAFEKKLLPLDVFSKSSIAVLHMEKDADILLSSDHNATYFDYLPISFENYFNNLISTKGLIKERPLIFMSNL